MTISAIRFQTRDSRLNKVLFMHQLQNCYTFKLVCVGSIRFFSVPYIGIIPFLFLSKFTPTSVVIYARLLPCHRNGPECPRRFLSLNIVSLSRHDMITYSLYKIYIIDSSNFYRTLLTMPNYGLTEIHTVCIVTLTNGTFYRRKGFRFTREKLCNSTSERPYQTLLNNNLIFCDHNDKVILLFYNLGVYIILKTVHFFKVLLDCSCLLGFRIIWFFEGFWVESIVSVSFIRGDIKILLLHLVTFCKG